MRKVGTLVVSLSVLLVIQGLITGCATEPTSTDVISTAMPNEITEQSALVWERELTDGCQTVIIAAGGQASLGPCSNPSSMAGQLEPGRPADLSYFLDRYRPFDADTPAGMLSFAGRGTHVATQSERQALAEWATLVHQELKFGRSGASWGLAIALNEEGATPCCRTQIEVYGKVFANDCRAGIQPYPIAWLPTEQIDELYVWMNEFQAFEMKWTEGGLPMRLVFSGKGARVATEAEQGEILVWVSGFYESIAR